MVPSSHQQWEHVLNGLQDWAEARALLTVAGAGEAGATVGAIGRATVLPESQVRKRLERLVAAGYLVTRLGEGGEERYFLGPSVIAAMVRGHGHGHAANGGEAAPVVDSSPVSSPRAVASRFLKTYWRLFRARPSLPWLMGQRKRAERLGLDLEKLMEEAYLNRPAGDPQVYLEAMLRRREREKGSAAR